MEDVKKQGWKYQLKSTVLTFVVSFLGVLLLSIQELDVSSVKTSLEAGGLIAGLRILGKMLIVPVFESLWVASKHALASLLEFLKGK